MKHSTKQFAHVGCEFPDKPYHYKACGLDDVYLLNGYKRVETDYGSGVQIENVESLHKTICMYIVSAAKPLKPKEFKFLRKQLNYTQQYLAELMRVDVQTIARYEKGETSIPGAADFTLKAL